MAGQRTKTGPRLSLDDGALVQNDSIHRNSKVGTSHCRGFGGNDGGLPLSVPVRRMLGGETPADTTKPLDQQKEEELKYPSAIQS